MCWYLCFILSAGLTVLFVIHVLDTINIKCGASSSVLTLLSCFVGWSGYSIISVEGF